MDARHLAHVKFETKAAGSTNELFDQLSSSAALFFHCLVRSASAVLDSPPSPSASSASRMAACVRCRSSLPPSDSISHRTFAATSLDSTIFLSYPSIGTASRISSTRNTLFMRCSAYSGHASIGTPAATASSTEFQPQCVTKPPTAPCASTCRCGAQDMTTRPLSLVRFRKPSGKSVSRSRPSSSPSAGGRRSAPGGGGRRTTHRNRCPLASSPAAISLTCSAQNRPMLPKQRNTTLASGWPSSHARHSWRFVVPVSSSGFISGPMQYSGGVGSPGGVQRPEMMASTARVSKERQLLTRTPRESFILLDSSKKCLLLRLSRSMTAAAR
ncbi:hypothetical protein VPH35_093446 [Triticum aestivum]